jgi:uncharacterized damage-inducible protein DinB
MVAMTTTATDLLRDAFGRTHDRLPAAVTGLTADELLWRVDADANPVGWLVWHLTRVQDDHMATIGELPQVWDQGWADRFGLPYERMTIGYGQSSDEVGAFDVGDATLLTGYHDEVHAQSLRVVDGLSDADLDRVVDASWDPPVTVAVRLVSVVNEIAQHTGQASYLRGLLDRRRG